MIFPLWSRYIFLSIFKAFICCICGFYLLYTLMDYSLHATHFSKIDNLHVVDLITYYFYLFIKRLDIILPLAFLIAVNKTLFHLNHRLELIALLAGGLSKTKIFLLLFWIATAMSCILLANFEYCTPRSLTYLEDFENRYLKKNILHNYKVPSAYMLAMGNGDRLLFSRYDIQHQTCEDVYYFCSDGDLWKMKTLSLSGIPQGAYVELLKKTQNHLLIKKHSYITKEFPDLIVDFSIRKKATLPFEHQSLSQLGTAILNKSPLYLTHAMKVQTHLLFKLMMALTPFLLIISTCPFCLIFSRRLRIYKVYAMSIFGTITFFTIMDAAVIVGESGIFAPWVATMAPVVLVLLGFGWNFIKSYSN